MARITPNIQQACTQMEIKSNHTQAQTNSSEPHTDRQIVPKQTAKAHAQIQQF